jgi:hypothetical protein
MVGISVARMFCRKRYITRNTKTIASINVLTTSSIEILTNGVVSYGYSATSPRLAKGVVHLARFVFDRTPAPFLAEGHCAERRLRNPESGVAQKSVFHVKSPFSLWGVYTCAFGGYARNME